MLFVLILNFKVKQARGGGGESEWRGIRMSDAVSDSFRLQRSATWSTVCTFARRCRPKSLQLLIAFVPRKWKLETMRAQFDVANWVFDVLESHCVAYLRQTPTLITLAPSTRWMSVWISILYCLLTEFERKSHRNGTRHHEKTRKILIHVVAACCYRYSQTWTEWKITQTHTHTRNRYIVHD